MKATKSIRSIAENAASSLQMQREIERLKKNALRRGKKKRRDHIVPLRKKRGRRDYGRYVTRNPVCDPARKKANKTRRVNRVLNVIRDVIEEETLIFWADEHPALGKLRAALNRVL